MIKKTTCLLLSAAVVLSSLTTFYAGDAEPPKAMPVASEEEVILPDEAEENSGNAGNAGNADAAENTEVSELITYIKSLFGIGAEYDGFGYSYIEDEGVTRYNFQWAQSNDSDKTIDVSVYSDKYINSYRKSEEKQGILGTVTKTQAQTAADSFLNKVFPNEFRGNLKFSKVSPYSFNYNVVYDYFINDIPVSNTNASVQVSKYTNEVVYYYAPDHAVLGADAPKPEGFISSEKAIEIFKENSEMGFKYSSAYNSETGGYNVFSVYRLKEYITAVNAVTGEAVKDDSDYGGAGGSSKNMYAESADVVTEEAEEYSLSEAEITSIKEKEGLLTAEEALTILEKEIYIADKSNMFSELYKNSENDKYFIELYINNDMVDIEAKLNAETGEVIDYYNFAVVYDENAVSAPSYEDMEKTANRIASAFGDSEFSQTVLNYKQDTDYYERKIYGYNFKYERTANGLTYPSNYLQVCFNNAGVLESYSKRWNEDISFPSVSDAIGEEKAYDALYGLKAPKLCYTLDEKGKLTAVYSFDWANIMLDKKGARIDYKGEPYKEDEEFTGYTDIEGTKYADIIMLLYDNGYYVNRSEFKPNEPISTEDFADFFKFPVNSGEDGYTFYFVPHKTYGETLTRYEAAEIIAYDRDFGKLGSCPDVFSADYYKDEIDPAYLPYVAVCYGLGYMRGDQNDTFNGDTLLTNTEAALLLYNCLSN